MQISPSPNMMKYGVCINIFLVGIYSHQPAYFAANSNTGIKIKPIIKVATLPTTNPRDLEIRYPKYPTCMSTTAHAIGIYIGEAHKNGSSDG